MILYLLLGGRKLGVGTTGIDKDYKKIIIRAEDNKLKRTPCKQQTKDRLKKGIL